MIGLVILLGFVSQDGIVTASYFNSWPNVFMALHDFSPDHANSLVQLVQEHEIERIRFRFQHDFKFGAVVQAGSLYVSNTCTNPV